VKAPGAELFAALKEKIGSLPFIAEDLGLITPDVQKLRDDLGLPGMRVLQFAFGGGADNTFLPHHYPRNAVVYTGTHDNDTTAGWFKSLPAEQQAFVRRYCSAKGNNVVWPLIRLALASIADRAIIPMQDLLNLGSSARINTPGTAAGNWTWRTTAEALRRAPLAQLKELTETYGRAP
jgi:4-alpha-glucanotransferase